MWPEVPPAQPYDQSIQELTGQRPYKGTLMYYHQFGIQDPYEAEEAPEPNPRQRTSDLIYYLEQSHHDHQTARHKPSHTLLGQRLQTHINKEFREQAPRRAGKLRDHKPPQHSRELVGPPRPGRATELFQQGRVRADHHVVDESNVCPVVSRSKYRPGPKFTFKKSPWSAASDSAFGDPRDAFEENRPPPVERLHRQQPLRAKVKAPREKPRPGVVEMDYARPPQRGGGGHYNPQQQQPIRTSTSWKGGPHAPQSGAQFKRFHANVVPYETDFNRKATGWSSNYVHEEPTDPIFAQDDLDSYQSPSFHGGGGGGHPQQRHPQPQQQYGDYNPRPKTWQSQGQPHHQEEEEEEPYVPYDQKRQVFQQEDQQQYYHEQQQQQQRQQQHHQPRGRGQQQQRHPGHAPRPGRGSSAPRQNYAGPQQQTWSGGLTESDDL